MLFADAADDGRVALLIAVGGLIGGAVQWGLAKALDFRTARKKEADEDEKRVTDYQESLLKRLDAERQEILAENRKLNERCTRLDVLVAKVLSHVQYLEGCLKDRDIKFRQWDDGSSVHVALGDKP
jgi:hypothetical protein